jgi:branched-chain amino acid transport system permease protein
VNTTHRLLRAAWPLLSLLVFVAGTVLILTAVRPTLDGPITDALITLIVVVGIYTFVGTSGVLSFGHVAFMAIGAFVCGILTIPTIARSVIIPNVPAFFPDSAMGTLPGVVLGGLAAALVGVVIGIPIVRMNGLAAGLAMFAVLLIANVFFTTWSPGIGGGGTLTRVPVDSTPHSVLVWAMICLCLSYAFKTSRWGLRLRGSREDEPAARSLGVGVSRERMAAFVLSAFIAGIGGGLYGHFVGSFGGSNFFITTTTLTLAMLVVGGINSLAGAVTGTAVISVVNYVLDTWTNGQSVAYVSLHLPLGSSQITVALLMLVVLILRPEGLTRGREFSMPRTMQWRPFRKPAAEADMKPDHS